MSEELDPTQELTSWEEVSYSNMVQNEAVLRLLVKKGIITKEECIKEKKPTRLSSNKKMRNMSNQQRKALSHLSK